MKTYRSTYNESGMAVLETALCLIVFVFIFLATTALFFYLFNQQIVEHAVYANAGKVRTVPYRTGMRGGELSYELVSGDLKRSIDSAADSLMMSLSEELIGFDTNSLTVQVGYLQLTRTSSQFSVLNYADTTRGNARYAQPLDTISPVRLNQTMAGVDNTKTGGPAPVLLRVRVYLSTDAFTRFDLLRVAPHAIEFDVMMPLRQQVGLLARAHPVGESCQMVIS